jgi:small-conductance mechanosensitive channel
VATGKVDERGLPVRGRSPLKVPQIAFLKRHTIVRIQAAGKGRSGCQKRSSTPYPSTKETSMNNIVYIIGLIVVVIAILSFFGLR